jgi:hypothetical protein
MFLCLYQKKNHGKEIHMVRSGTDELIMEYVEYLKTQGYEIIEFPIIEKTIGRTYSTNLVIQK